MEKRISNQKVGGGSGKKEKEEWGHHPQTFKKMGGISLKEGD